MTDQHNVIRKAMGEAVEAHRESEAYAKAGIVRAFNRMLSARQFGERPAVIQNRVNELIEQARTGPLRRYGQGDAFNPTPVDKLELRLRAAKSLEEIERIKNKFNAKYDLVSGPILR